MEGIKGQGEKERQGKKQQQEGISRVSRKSQKEVNESMTEEETSR